MDINWEKEENKQLVAAVLALQTTDDAERFLRDILTESEITEFSKRLEAARMLSRKIQYAPIIEKTGLSSTTIARIAKWLRGPIGGYRLVLNRIGHHGLVSKLGKGLS